jgi:hypothetical protein
MATWNIVDGRGGRLKQVATGLAQMGIGLVALTETKLVNNEHPQTTSKYTSMCLKAVSDNQGGGCAHLEGGRPKI